MSLHPDYRPSAIEKCVLCPGNLKMCEELPRTSSPQAEEGTMLHDKIAKHSTEGLSSEQVIMVERCFELIKRLTTETSTVSHEIEMAINDDDFNEIVKGTADLVIIDGAKGTLCDWKMGRNPVTDAQENWQLRTYATMMFQAYDIETCDCIVFQPRLGNAGFSKATFSREELADFPDKLKAIYESTQDGLMLKAGDKQCKYCVAKETCPEYKIFTGQISSAVANIEHTHALSTDELKKALMQTAQVKDFIKQLAAQVASVENVARERLMQNLITPDEIGYQLKSRKGARKCTNAQEVFNLLSDTLTVEDFMTIVDIGIPDLETLYGKKAKEKGMYKSQKDAVKAVNEKIAPYIERKSDSFTLERISE